MLVPENPVVGGTVLRRASIQSPNFVHNSTGWSINQDGSAEFNNLVVRNGQIISGTALYYSGVPSAANLVLAIAAANGTDAFGTNYYAGVTTYAASSGHSFPVTLLSIANSAFFQYNAPSGGVQGVLIAAVSAANGTDPVTAHSYLAGLYGIDPAFGDTIQTVGANINLGQVVYTRTADLVAHTAADAAHNPFVAVDAPEQTTANHMQMQWQGASPDGTRLPQALVGQVAGAAMLTPTSQAMLEVQGGAAQPVLRLQIDASSTSGIEFRAAADAFLRMVMRGDGRIGWGGGSLAVDSFLQWLSANRMGFTGCDLAVHTAGRGLQVAEGTNAKQGRGTLVAGSLVVATTAVTANSIIYPGMVTPSASAGALFVSAVTVGTGFTIKSTNGADTSVVGWRIDEPG